MSKMKLAPLASALLARRWPHAIGSLLVPGLALAGPTGGNVVGGQATISAPDASTTVINQASGSAVIHWQQFDVGSDEYVVFNQPSASAAVLNKVVGGSASEILGHLQSNGRVFIINPQGVLFGAGAQVNVGSLVASTLDIADGDFMQGKYLLSGAGSGNVVNNGQITAADGGFVVLTGDTVKNNGLIAAKLGDVVLASGNAVTLDLNGNGLINVAVDQASLSQQAGVDNLGDIIAQGGTVVMAARTARGLLQAAVNNSGTIRAQGITEQGGDIFLTAEGGDIINSGTLDASGKNGHDAGSLLIQSDADIGLASTSTVDITGRNGGVAHIIAGKTLHTSAGGLIDGRANDQGLGKGGFVELSGHGSMLLDSGMPLLGKGGALLLDPTNICIGAGSSGTCTGSFDTTIHESDIEASLNYGTDVYIIASENIFGGSGLSIDSTNPANLLLGIGYADDGYAGVTGGFGQSPLQSIPGNFVVSDSASYGNISFQGVTPGSISIGGTLTVQGATNIGDVTLGNISARGVDIRGFGKIKLGNVTASVSDLLIASDTAVQAGQLTATQGGIFLRFKNSATASSLGGLTANDANYGGICINDGNCDFEYSTFAGTGGTPANLTVAGGTTNWSARYIQMDHTAITGGTLNLSASDFGHITIENDASATLTKLKLDTAGEIYIHGATIAATTLEVNAGYLDIREGAALSGTTATLVEAATSDTSYSGIADSSLDFSASLSISAPGSFYLDNVAINSALNVSDPASITGHSVSLTADDIEISGDNVLNAGQLTLTANAGDVEIRQGAHLNFKSGVFTAIEGVVEGGGQVLSALTEGGGGEIGIPIAFGGDIGIGDYLSAGYGGVRDTAVLTFNTLTLNSDNTFIEHSTLTGSGASNLLTVNSPVAIVQDSAFSGRSASFISSPAQSEFIGDYSGTSLQDSTFNYTGDFTASTNHVLDIQFSDFNTGASPLAGSGLHLTGANVSLYESFFQAAAIEVNAVGSEVYDGTIIDNSTFRYDSGKFGLLNPAGTATTQHELYISASSFEASTAGSSSFAAKGSLNISNSSISGRDATITLTGPIAGDGYSQIADSAITLDRQNGNLRVISGDGFIISNTEMTAKTFSGTGGSVFDITNSTLDADSAVITANSEAVDDGIGDGVSTVFSGNDFTLSNSFIIRAAKGIRLFATDDGETGNSNTITAPNITLDAGTFIDSYTTAYSGNTGIFNARGMDTNGYIGSGYSIAINSSDLGFETRLDINGTGSIDFFDSVITSPTVEIHAGDSVTFDGVVNASISVAITAGAGTGFKTLDPETDILYLAGSINGGTVKLFGKDGVQQTTELGIEANALDVGGQYIDLASSYISVGNGIAAQGADPILLQAMASKDAAFPRPNSSRPNASFKAIDEVRLGTVDFSERGGDYLFVQASNFSFYDISFDNSLFLNFTPSVATQGIGLQNLGFYDAPSGLTLALGGSNYLGNITVASQEEPVFTENQVNFVFATRGGKVTGLDNLSTNGRVLVLTDFGGNQEAGKSLNEINNIKPSNKPAGVSGSESANGEGTIEIEDSTKNGDDDNEFECT